MSGFFLSPDHAKNRSLPPEFRILNALILMHQNDPRMPTAVRCLYKGVMQYDAV